MWIIDLILIIMLYLIVGFFPGFIHMMMYGDDYIANNGPFNGGLKMLSEASKRIIFWPFYFYRFLKKLFKKC